jgi:hypothetical protein
MIISEKSLRGLGNNVTINRLLGWFNRITHFQGTPATATTKAGLITQPGVVGEVYLVVRGVAAAGESLGVDVLVNGVSVLTAPYTFDATKNALVGTQIPLPIDETKVNLACGDLVSFQRTLTGGSTITESQITLEPTSVKQR